MADLAPLAADLASYDEVSPLLRQVAQNLAHGGQVSLPAHPALLNGENDARLRTDFLGWFGTYRADGAG